MSTSYELWKGKVPNLKHLYVFECLCYILKDRKSLGKFDTRSDFGMFLGYSRNSKTFRVYNLKTKTIMESVNIVFDDYKDIF